MYRKVLIPVDESAPSEYAARVGLQFAARLGAEVAIVHVLGSDEHQLLDSSDPKRRDCALLERWRANAGALGIATSTHASSGPVAETIVQLGQEVGADLILIGTHGRRGVSGVLLGSVAERVSRLASSPVMLVRSNLATPAFPDFSRILVAVSDDPSRQVALEHADRLAARLGALLCVLRVAPRVPQPPVVGQRFVNTLAQTRIKQIMDEAQARLRHNMVMPLVYEAGDWSVGAVIARVAQERQVDLVVTGSHSPVGLEHLLLGSVAEYVAHHAPSPVLIVRDRHVGAVLEPPRPIEFQITPTASQQRHGASRATRAARSA